jgi:hypothetical protein
MNDVKELFPFGLPALVVVLYMFNLYMFRGQNSSVVVHVVIFVVVVYLLYAFDISGVIEGKSKETLLARQQFVNSSLSNITYGTEDQLVGIYNDNSASGPATFKYLKRHADLVDVLRDLRFVRHFDDGSYRQASVLLERFLRLYYKLLVSDNPKYCGLMLSTLHLLRQELLNTFNTMIMGIPTHFKRPMHMDKVPTDKYILSKQRYIQGVTGKKLRIISKISDNPKSYDKHARPPWPANLYKSSDERYLLF